MTTVSVGRNGRFLTVVLPLLLCTVLAGGTVWARIDGLPFDGSSSGDRNAGRSEAAAPSGTVPHEYGLSQNFPNPFNPSTIIRYAIPLKSHVLLTVHNLLGQVVATVVNQDQEAGFHEVRFDAVNLSSGVYLYRLEAGKFVETRKLTLLK